MYHRSEKLVDFYLGFGNTEILLWNYRGYGKSTGTPTLGNIKTDALAVYEYISNYYRWSKVFVHGISIGGVPACFLVKKRLVDVAFIDRSFSNLHDVVESFFLGSIASRLLQLLGIPRSESQNARMFNPFSSVRNKNTKKPIYRFISCDPYDTIVKDSASLKTGLANTITHELLHKGDESTKPTTKNTEQNGSSLLDSSTNTVYNPSDKYKPFSRSIVELFKFIDENEVLNYNEVLTKTNSNTSHNDSEYLEIYTQEMDVIKDIDVNFEQSIISKLKTSLNQLDAAELSLSSILAVSSFRLAGFLSNFTANLIQYGSYKLYDNEGNRIKNTMDVTPCNMALSKVIDLLQITDNMLENKNKLSQGLISLSSNVREYLELVKERLTERLSRSNWPEVKLIPLACGHNGTFAYEEFKEVQKHLELAEFI